VGIWAEKQFGEPENLHSITDRSVSTADRVGETVQSRNGHETNEGCNQGILDEVLTGFIRQEGPEEAERIVHELFLEIAGLHRDICSAAMSHSTAES
jgi:hypothetical protein